MYGPQKLMTKSRAEFEHITLYTYNGAAIFLGAILIYVAVKAAVLYACYLGDQLWYVSSFCMFCIPISLLQNGTSSMLLRGGGGGGGGETKIY